MPYYRTGKPPPLGDLLKDVAEQGGLFTTHQAEQRGISKQLLSYHAKQGKLERVAHGVYRSSYAPTSRHEDVIARVLPYGEGAVASGPTALDIYDVGQLAPDKVYVKQQPDTPSGPIPSTFPPKYDLDPIQRAFRRSLPRRRSRRERGRCAAHDICMHLLRRGPDSQRDR